MSEDFKLQPLRIPSGWTVETNTLHEVDPQEQYMYPYFSGSVLFYAEKKKHKVAVDVAWVPEEEVDGEYQVTRIALRDDGKAGDEEELFSTRDRQELITKLELFLQTAHLPPTKMKRFQKFNNR